MIRVIAALLAVMLPMLALPPARAEGLRTLTPESTDEVLAHVVLALPSSGALPSGSPGSGAAAPVRPREIGHIADVLVDATGRPVAAVLDVGGFMGVGVRKVAVVWAALHFAPGKDGVIITLDLPVDRIRRAPEYKGHGKAVVALEQ